MHAKGFAIVRKLFLALTLKIRVFPPCRKACSLIAGQFGPYRSDADLTPIAHGKRVWLRHSERYTTGNPFARLVASPMAKVNQTATVQEKSVSPAGIEQQDLKVVVSPDVLKQIAEGKAKERASVLESVSFSEAFGLASKSARWNDVLTAASAFAPIVEQASKSASDGKPTAIARKAASVAPSLAMEFRFALASYSLSGRTANATQLAELAGKLPQLATKGSLRDRAVTFGGIVLPPIAGEI